MTQKSIIIPLNSEPVILHIYSISESINRFSLLFGVGLYHTAVEVYGREYSFIGHPFKFTGIITTIPKTAAYIYQEGLDIGRTNMTKAEVDNYLKELGTIFTGSSYHLLRNNCNRFANKFINGLCNGKLPTYINRAANSVCCLSFLDTMFNVKIDSERFFVEVLYLTLNGDINYVMDILDIDQQTNLLRYASYIEASFNDYSIPKCFPYYPIIKNYNPFTLSKEIIELIKKNLCPNFIFTQSKNVYDFAFDLYNKLQARKLQHTILTDCNKMVIPEISIYYSTDIYHYLNQCQKIVIETIKRFISEHTFENKGIFV
ncbi:unnamed protein product [Adineta steineri]|uniref:PPPDE domain-containing protein n=1 Tax=Adineta steineri TaxID=433720 RepID=A0A818H8Q1_9BILA|nr:unnamed protein product [Adineta steineri]CAF3503944.1 unnamed protein product [Adineta steineri]